VSDTSRVLLVEDDEIISDVLIDVLIDEGYDVRHARDGRQALQVLEEWRPGVIVLDLTTPGMDGWSFRAAQLQLPTPLARVPVVVLTGAYVAESRTEALAAAAIISKPFDLGGLLEVVARVCRECRDPADRVQV
jgi:CheY-like chemotaxis protein